MSESLIHKLTFKMIFSYSGDHTTHFVLNSTLGQKLFWKFRISENDFKKLFFVRKFQLGSNKARIIQFRHHSSEL